jgi:hypothetical protein
MCTPSFSPAKESGSEINGKVTRGRRLKAKSYKLTNEIELDEALAELKDALEASVLGVCRTLQREEVNEEIWFTWIKH